MNSIFFSNIKNKLFYGITEKGMTLAELLFAMAIVGTVLVTMIGALTSGLEALQKSTSYNQATIIAQKTIEMYKPMDFTSIASTGSAGVTKSDHGFSVNIIIDDGVFVGDHTGTTMPIKKITVKVTKTGEKGARKTKQVDVTMESFLIDH